jgi:hypothetical protein
MDSEIFLPFEGILHVIECSIGPLILVEDESLDPKVTFSHPLGIFVVIMKSIGHKFNKESFSEFYHIHSVSWDFDDL